ncbi:MAG: radical SAM protein [Myxococcota bacterium]|nr:radical SAM protein [Myxococcota bacterium]
MRVSIVVPPFDYGRQLYGLVRRRSFHNAVPLGAISVAAYLREQGHQVQVVDAPAMDIDINGICAEVNRFVPDAIGLGCTSLIFPAATKAAEVLKERFGVPIFLGGTHASLFPEHVMEYEAYDAAVFGEGEETAVELIDRMSRGESLEGVAGVIFRGEDGSVIKNKPRIPVQDLDDAPLPAYDLLDLSRYSAPPMRIRRSPAVYMELFRGCAYAKCSYCTSGGGLKNRYRRHSPAAAAEKILQIHMKYGANEIAFVDDDFVVGKDWIYDFCGELRSRGNPVTWTAYCRASQVDAGIFHAMKASGCHQVLIGMEVLDNETLRALNKDLTVGSCGAAVRAAHSAGISVIGLFMTGLPNTRPDSVYRTVEHALQQEVDVAVFSLYRPPPGSPVYEQLGWGPEEYIDCFKKQKEAVFVPEGWQDIAEVERVFSDAYRKFYLDPRFLRRTTKRALADPILAKNIVKGALTLADQFRPSFGFRSP